MQTVEAEITVIMISQRARVAESGQTPDYQMDRGGRSQMVVVYGGQSILRRGGIRQLPGICWYPAKCVVHCCKSRWHRG